MSWNEFWHWLLLGEMAKPWMHGVMAVVWLGLAAIYYFGKPTTAHRIEWLMFCCWAFGAQLTLFLEKANP